MLFNRGDNIKKILLFSLLIIMIPYIIVSIFIKNDEITFNFSSNSVVRVYREKLDRIDRVPIEEYVVGVVAGEIPVSFNIEALKAQAVASRSYVMYQIKRNKNKDFDVYDTVRSQVYLDASLLKDKWGDDYVTNVNRIKEAVIDTAGEYLVYDGEVVEAMFFSTSSGVTENSEDVFSNSVPYLRSVSSTWDEISPVYMDSKKFSKEEFYNLLNLKYQEKMSVNTNTTSTGRVIDLVINDKKFSGRDIVSKLGIRSSYFVITEYDDSIVVDTKGYGHGVGVSQYGAEGMARDGYSYDEILKYYHSGVEIKKF